MLPGPKQISDAAISEYLSILGVKSAEEKAAQVLSLVRDALRKSAGGDSLVRLAPCAPDFDIEPVAEFAPLEYDGELVYSQPKKKFIIYISDRYRAAQRPAPRGPLYGEPAEPEHLGRARFTYAHEFCHRFFFVAREGRWERAMTLAAERHPVQSDRAAVLRAATAVEERLCNRLAGELLLPTDALAAWVPELMSPVRAQANIRGILSALTRRYLVSQECAFVRLERAVREGKIRTDPGLAALWLAWSGKKGAANGRSSGTSRTAIRVASAVWPSTVAGHPIRRLFPGIAAANLGDEILKWTADRLSPAWSGDSEGALGIGVCLQLSTTTGDRLLRARLRGRWDLSRATREGDSPSLLLWGSLDPG